MPDLDDLAASAVAAPLAPPTDVRELQRIVVARRRRRTLAMCALMLVAVGTVSAAAWASRSASPRAITTRGERPGGSTVTAAGSVSTADLVERLARVGVPAYVVRGPNEAGRALLGVRPTAVCADHHILQVYEYESSDMRSRQSREISADGSELGIQGNTRTIVDWIASPHFFARGRVIVLYLGSDQGLVDALTRVLGPTISPDAPAMPGREGQTC